MASQICLERVSAGTCNKTEAPKGLGLTIEAVQNESVELKW
jgi:hypothetical protein